MNIILFDDSSWEELLPLTYTRPVSEIRIGILNIREKWEKYFNATFSYRTAKYLGAKFPLSIADDNLYINGSVIPEEILVDVIANLKSGTAILSDGILIACRLDRKKALQFESFDKSSSLCKDIDFKILKINHLWDIFSLNEIALNRDFDLLTKNRKSAPISSSNQLINPDKIFFEEGAIAECSILNASTGPIYVGKDAEIMEGSIVRGALALCEHSALKLGTKIYGPTTIGPYSKVGGEVNNSVIFGYSNKGHDGFLGNSVIGEWCNLGADTNNSNLKNNYAEVKLWNESKNRFVSTGLQFCGLIMGDHSKCGINTMFNTGTVAGVSANIFGSGFPRNFIPSFSWGGASGFTTYQIDKACETAGLVFERRKKVFDTIERNILENVFQMTQKQRNV